VIVLVIFGFFKRKLFAATSDQLNDYCFDAYKSYVFLSDNEAIVALETCLIILGDEQRQGMFKALDNFSKGIKNLLTDNSATNTSTMNTINRIEEVEAIIEKIKLIDCSMQVVFIYKTELQRCFPAAATALNKFHGNYFKEKHHDSVVFKE
jgi:hypothetical protein